jgi:hypothetical protein
MEGYHDDLLMSLAMALWVVEHSFKNLERLEKQNKAMLSSWLGGSSNNQTTTNIKNPVTGDVTKKINPEHKAYRNVQDPRGEHMWVFGNFNNRK